jgi:hypothetical protein
MDRLQRTLSQLSDVFHTSFAVLAGYWPKDNPPPPEALFRVLLLALFPLSFLVFAFVYREKLRPFVRGRLTPEAAALGFAILVVLVFAQSSFGWMTEGLRYLLFLFSVMPLFHRPRSSALPAFPHRGARGRGVASPFERSRGFSTTPRRERRSNREFSEARRALDPPRSSDYHLSYNTSS